LNRRRLLLIPLSSFALFETALTIIAAGQFGAGPAQTGASGPFSLLWTYSPHLAVVSWTAVVATIVLGRSGKGIFAKKGFQDEVYNLIVKMRGGESRLAILRSLETPRHRYDLSGATGLDWKEVDRQLSILENYGLVKIHAQSGSVKLYQITEQGRILIKLVDDLTHNRAVEA
jgi:DNA-binding transcriptional ArsR family regulator